MKNTYKAMIIGGYENGIVIANDNFKAVYKAGLSRLKDCDMQCKTVVITKNNKHIATLGHNFLSLIK